MPRKVSRKRSLNQNAKKQKRTKATKRSLAMRGTQHKERKKVLAIPKGYHSITPYLIVKNAAKAIEFYKSAFGAKERLRMEMPPGTIRHAELVIGDAVIMLADEIKEMAENSPEAFGGSPVAIHLYVKNVDQVVEDAIVNGAILIRPIENAFYGDRTAKLTDPSGHVWAISTHIEDVSNAKIRKRAEELFREPAEMV